MGIKIRVFHYFDVPGLLLYFFGLWGLTSWIFSGKDVSLRESWAGMSGSDLSFCHWLWDPQSQWGLSGSKRMCVYLNLSRRGMCAMDVPCLSLHSFRILFFFFFLFFVGCHTYVGTSQGAHHWMSWPCPRLWATSRLTMASLVVTEN